MSQPSQHEMSRKALAAMVVLLLAGLSPAAAIIGFCSRMPCCSHAAATRHVSASSTDCCATITCYDAPSAKLNPGSAERVVAAPFMVSVASIATAINASPSIHLPDPSPPRRLPARLAVLSILII